jgi:hypothetical protein
MDTEYRTMHNLFDGAVYEDFVFLLHQETVACGKIGSGRSPFSASKSTKTKRILFPDTDFVPKNREPFYN